MGWIEIMSVAEATARHRPVADHVPVVHHRLRPEEQLHAQLTGGAAALREARELPDQVRPADLALFHRPEAELRAAVCDEDAANAGKQPRSPARLASVTMPKTVTNGVAIVQSVRASPDCRHRWHRRSCSIARSRRRAPLRRHDDGLAHVAFGFAQGPSAMSSAEKVAEQSPPRVGSACNAGQHSNQRHQPWPAHPSRNAGRHAGARGPSAVAGHGVQQIGR